MVCHGKRVCVALCSAESRSTGSSMNGLSRKKLMLFSKGPPSMDRTMIAGHSVSPVIEAVLLTSTILLQLVGNHVLHRHRDSKYGPLQVCVLCAALKVYSRGIEIPMTITVPR